MLYLACAAFFANWADWSVSICSQMRLGRKGVLWDFLGWLICLTASPEPLCVKASLAVFSCLLWSGTCFSLRQTLKCFFSEAPSCFRLLLYLYLGVSQHSVRCAAVKAASLRWCELSENILLNNGCGFMVDNVSDSGHVYGLHMRPTPISV